MNENVDWTKILVESGIPSCCCGCRPFVCCGFPSDCKIVIIGNNPATFLNKDWWEFWKETSGFDYRYFSQVYEKEREKQGRTRTSSTSRTRERFDRFRYNGFTCLLETNVFSNEGGESERIRNRTVLEALLDNMPRQTRIGVFAHGKYAKKFISNYQCPTDWLVHPTCHLSLCSKEKRWAEIDNFCQELRQNTGL